MQALLKAGFKLPPWRRSICHSSAEEGRPRLQAIARHKREPGAAAARRARGLIPAVVFDGDLCGQSSSFLVFLRQREVSSCYKKMSHRVFMSTVFILHVSNSLKRPAETFEERVLPRTVNVNRSGNILNIRLMKVPEGLKLKLNCPIVIVGAKDCVGLLKGGLLRKYYNYVSLYCAAEVLPAVVEVDITKLDLGNRILIRDIELDVEMHPDMDRLAPVCEIISQDDHLSL